MATTSLHLPPWQACRYGVPPAKFHDAEGMPIVDGLKFPSLKASVDRAHALGLRAGFYVNNCLCAEVDMLSGDAPRIDAAITATSEAIVAIGYDAVKIDSCGDLKNISQA